MPARAGSSSAGTASPRPASACARCSTRRTASRRSRGAATFVYNFWQDAEHPRGLWRRTTLDDYRKATARPGTRCSTSMRWAATRARTGSGAARSLPGAGLHALPAAAVARRRRRDGGARVRSRHARASSKAASALPEAKSDVEWLRPRHALRRHRLRPRLADRFGLPAHHQALAPRPAAGRGARRCSRRETQRRGGQRQRGPHARLRAHRLAPRAGLLHQRGIPARRRPAAAAGEAGRRATAASGTARCC